MSRPCRGPQLTVCVLSTPVGKGLGCKRPFVLWGQIQGHWAVQALQRRWAQEHSRPELSPKG